MLSWISLPARHNHVTIMMDLTAVLGGLPLDTVEINFTYVVVSHFVLFSSPYQRQSELQPSLDVRRKSFVIRLPYGSAGVLEVYHNSGWGAVCYNYQSREHFDSVCEYLGYS